MSRMIPPYYDPAAVKSQAERDLFERFRDEPGTTDWVVLHSLALGEHKKQRAGEIDFLVITPLGVFVLEVKGGKIRRENGLWIYGSSHEERTTKPRGPFEQARDAMFSLEERLKAAGSPLAKLFFGYGVVAPDCSLKACVSRTEIADNPGVAYDFDDRRSSLPEYIKRLAAEASRHYSTAGIGDRFKPSKKDAEQLVSLLRGDFEAEVSDLSLAQDVGRNVVLLEEKQREALDAFVQDERVIVLGGAGTGKTILAMEAAIRAVQEGKRVLFLTYTKRFTNYIAAKLAINSSDLLRVSGIHEVMYKVIEDSPFAEELRAEFTNGDTFWHSWLPEHFTLVQSGKPMCDVLIVDEGQDILTEKYLDAVDTMVSGGLENGRWLWCMDDRNQGAVYGRCDDEANRRLRKHGVSTRLSSNIRNTRQIADAANRLAAPRANVPASMEGAAVSYYRVQDPKDERRRLISVLQSLLAEGVAPRQITVLSKHRNPSWDFAAVASELPAAIQLDDEAARKMAEHKTEGITFSTISGFKGLENDFIVVTEIDDLTSEQGRTLAYVAMTRTRAKLIMLLSPEADAVRLKETST
jgi:hypothetical protein